MDGEALSFKFFRFAESFGITTWPVAPESRMADFKLAETTVDEI